MTIALPRPRERVARHFDLSLPVLVLLALFLCGLVLLPLGWLAWYSITDKNGTPTLGNFIRLASDPDYRASIGAAILSRNAVLYSNLDFVRELEEFFVQAVTGQMRLAA